MPFNFLASRRAFTLLELLIVLLIIGILIAIGLYRYQSVVEAGYDKDAHASLRAGMLNAEGVKAKNGSSTYSQPANADGLNYTAWNVEPVVPGSFDDTSPKNILVSLQPGDQVIVFCNKSKADVVYCLASSEMELVPFAASNTFSATKADTFAKAYCALNMPNGLVPKGCGTGTDGQTGPIDSQHEGGTKENWLGGQTPVENNNPVGYNPDCQTPFTSASITSVSYNASNSYITVTGTDLSCFTSLQIDPEPWGWTTELVNPYSPYSYQECGTGIDIISWSDTQVVGAIGPGGSYLEDQDIVSVMGMDEGNDTTIVLNSPAGNLPLAVGYDPNYDGDPNSGGVCLEGPNN